MKKYDATRRQAQQAICVKCGFSGWITDLLPVAPDAKSRWSKFRELVTCPACGDDEGHCGILGNAPYEPLPAHSNPFPEAHISPIALRHTDIVVREIIDALSLDATIEALQAVRGYDTQLAFWLARRGIRFGSIDNLRFKVDATTLAKLPYSLSPSEPVFWLPVAAYRDGHHPTFIGFQVRRLNGDPKYLTIKFVDAPLVHIALPTEDRTDGQRFSGVWLTEGILKAEVLAHQLGVVAVGALGTGALRQAIPIVADAARRWHKDANFFVAPIVLAPDADARTKLSVAKAWWQVAKHLQGEGFPVSFAVWSPCYKGIDDSLLAGETPTIVPIESWLAGLQSRIRNDLLQIRICPRLLIDGETAQALDLPESNAPSANIVAQTYEVAKRKQTWLVALSSPTNKGKAVVVVDTSPTGSGKTHAAASLRLSELRKAGLFAKRVVYISPEVKRTAVRSLERFRLFIGRDELCPYWKRLSELESEGLTQVGKRICAYCPMKKQCAYYAQKQSGGRRYWRVSWQSYSPKEGDFLILDEFSRLPLWRDFAVTPDQLATFIGLLDRYGAAQPIMDAFKVLEQAVNQRRSLSHEEVAQIFSAVRPEHWDALAHDILVLFSDIRKVRSWIFKETDQRPVWLGWAQSVVDIFRGHNIGQIWWESGTLKVKVLDSKLKDAVRKASAVLVLDATANPSEIERLLNTKVITIKSDEPERLPKVFQVPLGALSHRANPEAKRRWLWMAKQVVEALQRKEILPTNVPIGVLTHKADAEFAGQIFGKSAVVGWWGRDDRATNAFFDAGVQVLVAVGLPHRNISAIAAERLKAGTRQRAFRKAKLDPQGHWWTILREFADPELAAAVRQEAAVAYLQAAGRLRQGRRSEPCYLVVLDTEPLPEALNPTILPPDQVLPKEVLQDWQRRRQRGVAVINALRQKAAAERLAKAVDAVRLYQTVVGEVPKPAWLARVLGVHRDTARKLLTEVRQTADYIFEKGKETEDTVIGSQMNSAVCLTLEDALRAFLSCGYPLPVRALARRFGASKDKVGRLARRLAKAQPQPTEQIPADAPANTYADEQPSQISPNEATHDEALPCPRCGEPLSPDSNDVIGCIGCGAGWRLTEQGLEPLPDQPDRSDQADLPPDQSDQTDDDFVIVVCPHCGSQRSVPTDAYMLAEPRCFLCGSVMHPAPTDPTPEPERFVDTEDWINAWWREVDPSATPPTEVVALELLDGEIIPPERLFLSRKAICSRCGHQKEVQREALLPPLCLACGFPMAWESG